MDCPCLIKREKDYGDLKDEEKIFFTESVNTFSAIIRRMLSMRIMSFIKFQDYNIHFFSAYRTNYVEVRKSYKILKLEMSKEQELHKQQINEERQKVEQERQNVEEALKVERINHDHEIQEEKRNNEKYLNEIKDLKTQIKKLQDKSEKYAKPLAKPLKDVTKKLNDNVFRADTEDLFACDDDEDDFSIKNENEFEEDDEELGYFEDEDEVPCGQRCREETVPASDEEVAESPKRRNIFSVLQDSPEKEIQPKKNSNPKISTILKPVVDTSKWLSKADLKRPEQENAAPKTDAKKRYSKKDKKSPKDRNSSFLKSMPSTSTVNATKLKQSRLDFSSCHISPIATVTKAKKSGESTTDETLNQSKFLRMLKRKNSDSEELFNFGPRPKLVEEPKFNKINETITRDVHIDENETYCPELSSAIRIKSEPKTQEKVKHLDKDVFDNNDEEYQFSQSSDVILVPGPQNEQIIIDESSINQAEEFLREMQKEMKGKDDNIMNIGNQELR